jgi:hypothetical protein
MAEPQFRSTLTCPHCGYQATETMPTDACVAFYDCKGCGETLRPPPRKLLCFLFVRLGAVSTNSRGRGALLHSEVRSTLQRLGWKQSRQFVGVVAPQCCHHGCPICVGPDADDCLDLSPRLDGHCLHLDAQQCGRTHCRYTGPYYLAMIVPVAVVGLGITPLTPYGWIALGILILGGGYVIWWATERLWGKFSTP